MKNVTTLSKVDVCSDYIMARGEIQIELSRGITSLTNLMHFKSLNPTLQSSSKTDLQPLTMMRIWT